MSNTYILLKDMPQAKQGTEFVQYAWESEYRVNSSNRDVVDALSIPRDVVENNPEWFYEIKPLNHRVVSRRSNTRNVFTNEPTGCIYNLRADGLFYDEKYKDGEGVGLGMLEMWLMCAYEIIAVERLSDKAVFSLKENTDKGKISQFEVLSVCGIETGIRVLCDCDDGTGAYNSLDDLSKIEPKKEPVDKEYQALSFFSKGYNSKDVITPDINGTFTKDLLSADEMVLQHYPIHSLRRICDNKIFTVGDEFIFKGLKTPCEIQAFRFNMQGKIAIRYFNGIVQLKKIMPAPIPFLVTEDGFRHYGKQVQLFYVSPKELEVKSILGCNYAMQEETDENGIVIRMRNKWFKSPVAALHYVMNKKVMFTLEDIFGYFSREDTAKFVALAKERMEYDKKFEKLK